MRVLNFIWIFGGIIGALLITFLQPMAVHPVIQFLTIFGGNVLATFVIEIILFVFLGPKE